MDLSQIASLLELLEKHDVSEFQYKDDEVALRLRLGPPPAMGAMMAAPVAAPQLAPAPAPIATAASAAPAAAPASDAGTVPVESPMVGTFYRSPSPEAPAYANVGDRVSKGQVLCIVEAMKMMNEIESEVGGVIEAVCVENGQPVQYGQALFKVRPG